MIDNVAVMGQLHGGEYLVDFWGCRFILNPFDQYCKNEDWNSISEGLAKLLLSAELFFITLLKEIIGSF